MKNYSPSCLVPSFERLKKYLKRKRIVRFYLLKDKNSSSRCLRWVNCGKDMRLSEMEGKFEDENILWKIKSEVKKWLKIKMNRYSFMLRDNCWSFESLQIPDISLEISSVFNKVHLIFVKWFEKNEKKIRKEYLFTQ